MRDRSRRHPDAADSELRRRVIDRVAFVQGEVDALSKRTLIERTIGHIEGIERVVSHELDVAHSHCGDRAVKSAVRTLLDRISGQPTQTVAVAVKDGVATLAGTLASRRELNRFIINLPEHLHGGREIDNLVTVCAGDINSIDDGDPSIP